MRRKLLLLNVALLAIIAFTVGRLRDEYLQARRQEKAVMGFHIVPVKPPQLTPLQGASPVVPASYTDIAQKMLFARDRNSTVVIDPPAPPPPPPPMPPLPIVRGVMNLGDGAMAILSEKAESGQRGYKPGEQIGEFKLLSVNNTEIVFEWNGKPVTRRLDELKVIADQAAPQAAGDSRTAAPAAAAVVNPSGQAAPGVDIGKGNSACQSGDKSPAGTVVNGMRKLIQESPFGQRCYWEPVK